MNEKTGRILCSASICRLSHLTLGLALCLLGSTWLHPANAAVYRWEDDQGKTHYSEIVPQQYQGVAKPVEAPANVPDAGQRREALERARKEKDKAAAIQTDRQPPPASAPPTAPQPAGKRPAQTPTDKTDCETWQRLYMESMACFGPYNTVGGGVKPEAFDACQVVTEPPQSRCRLLIP